MRHELQVQLLEKLLGHVQAGTHQAGEGEASIPVERYFSESHLAEEKRVLFSQYPLVIGHVSALPAAGDFFTHDASGTPLLITRGQDGHVRAFLNVCRHRGTRLVNDSCGHRKAFTCRYHAWTYDNEGCLHGVPRKENFPSLDQKTSGLVPVSVVCNNGLIWAVPAKRGDALDISAYLGVLENEMETFNLGALISHKKVTFRRACNWKLMIDAFMEGYHIQSLHKASIAKFFHPTSVFESVGPHIRTITARRTIDKLPTLPRDQWNVRLHATPAYLLFPNTVLIFHPDWVSRVSFYPDGTDACVYEHEMLIQEAPKTDEERDHWERTFNLIEGTVFEKEDLEICESVQSMLRSGANETLRVGLLEYAIKIFHRSVDEALKRPAK